MIALTIKFSGFATALIVYIAVNEIPSVLWKTEAESENTSEPGVVYGILEIRYCSALHSVPTQY
jgi:hypothetical protein